MGKYSRRIVMMGFLALCFGLLGCNKEATPKVATDSKEFDTATTEVKERWGKIITAATNNDYSTAIIGCRKLSANQELTPGQRTAINGTLSAVSEKMTAAAEKGDAAAQQAIADIRKSWR